eukprot:9996280-Lingulodinium_polyedra.AAC.1
MWYQFPGLWKYKCLVCWEPLLREVRIKLRSVGERRIDGCGDADLWRRMAVIHGRPIAVPVGRCNQRCKPEFYMAAQDLTQEDLKDEFPMGFPMTHVGPDFPRIAKYPVGAWEEAGAPTMTTTGWA